MLPSLIPQQCFRNSRVPLISEHNGPDKLLSGIQMPDAQTPKPGCCSALPISHPITSVTDNRMVFYFSTGLFTMLIKRYKAPWLY